MIAMAGFAPTGSGRRSGATLSAAILLTWCVPSAADESAEQAVDPNMLPPDKGNTNPLGIAPFLNYRLGSGYYIGNGDMVALWDWGSSSLYMPIGVRFGKVLLRPKGSWNIYGEYQTSLIYKDWPGSAVENSIRINVTYTIPAF